MAHENLRPQRAPRQDRRHQEGRDHRACSHRRQRHHRHASITNEAIDDLGLKVGDKVLHAVIKASDVMVAIP
jgi:ABC-type molybdate transport system ATPase subunit